MPPEKVFLAHDITRPGLIFQDANVKVTAVENTHLHFRPGSPAEGKQKSYAFRLEMPDKTIVYRGDTGPSEHLVELATGADLLISEVINVSGHGKDARPVEGMAVSARRVEKNFDASLPTGSSQSGGGRQNGCPGPSQGSSSGSISTA